MLAHRADELRRLAEQPDPLCEEPLAGRGTPEGVGLARMRVPLGVLGVVYEARPITALEVLGPALRAGNAVLLRAALAAVHTDEALAAVIRDALDGAGLPADTVALLPTRERASIRYLVGAVGLLDLVIVRGGPRLVASALADAKVPALRLSSGNCHVYVDAAADQALAVDVVMRSKGRPVRTARGRGGAGARRSRAHVRPPARRLGRAIGSAGARRRPGLPAGARPARGSG